MLFTLLRILVQFIKASCINVQHFIMCRYFVEGAISLLLAAVDIY